MKILYGVQGTGNGHISRARMMAKYFALNKVDVTYLFSGRERQHYFAMDCFHRQQAPMYKNGLTYTIVNGQVNKLATLKNNNYFEFMRDVNALDLSGYDIVINDFEPITSWAAKLQKKTSIGIGHQYAFWHDIPLAGQQFYSQQLIRQFAPADYALGLHWHHFQQPILPPIIDTALPIKTKKKGKVIVYLPYDNQMAISQLLQKFPTIDFYQYSHQLDDGNIGRVHLRRPSLTGFKQDLMEAEGVISNAGFELLSECLHLGVDMLVKPIDGQMEQESNAKALETLGYATTCNQITEENIARWLDCIGDNEPVCFPNVAENLVQWILQGNYGDINQLARSMW